MQLTEKERKLVEQLRKQERIWSKLRWFCLAILGVLVAATINLHLLMREAIQKPQDHGAQFLITMIWPKIVLYQAVIVVMVFWLFPKWNGDTSRMLLLKLLDAQTSKDSKPT